MCFRRVEMIVYLSSILLEDLKTRTVAGSIQMCKTRA